MRHGSISGRRSSIVLAVGGLFSCAILGLLLVWWLWLALRGGEVLALTEPLLQAARAGGEDRVVAEILLVQGLALYPRGELTLAEATLRKGEAEAERNVEGGRLHAYLQWLSGG